MPNEPLLPIARWGIWTDHEASVIGDPFGRSSRLRYLVISVDKSGNYYLRLELPASRLI